MIKSVNIDGKDYIVKSCYECPFYDYGDEGCDDYCQYPENPSKLEESGTWGMYNKGIAEDCPLGLVEDCCTCKYEATKDEWVEPCCQCMVSWDSETGKESTPTKWEVKE